MKNKEEAKMKITNKKQSPITREKETFYTANLRKRKIQYDKHSF